MSPRGQLGSEPLVGLSGLAYGVHLRGALPAAWRAYLWETDAGGGGARLALEVGYRTISELLAVEESWVAEPAQPEGERFALFREPGVIGLTVRGEGRGLFRIGRRRIDVEWLRGGAGAAHYLFAYALPIWLEQAGVPVLHASAVSIAERAVALVGPTGAGKSTLCAELVRGGAGFLADDGLPLYEESDGGWVCAPGPPLFRLWPSALEGRLGVAAAELPRIHDGRDKRLLPGSRERAAPGATRLALVCVLDRRPGSQATVSSSPLSGRAALVRLLEHSVLAAPAVPLGWAERRFEQLARFVSRTPVRVLSYPTGGDNPDEVRRLLERDLAALASAGGGQLSG